MSQTWATVPMSEIAPLVRRPLPPKHDQLYRQIGLRSFGKGIFHKPPTTGVDIGSKRVFAVEPGDLLFNIVFAWEGAIAVATEAERGLVGSHRFLTCVADRRRADSRFLCYWFTHREGRERLLQASPGGAGRNRTLGVEKLAAIRVPLPALQEQLCIVARIEELAAKVVEAKELNEASLSAGGRLLSAMAHRSDLSVEAKLSQGWRRAILRDVLTDYSDPVPVSTDVSYPNFGLYSFGRGLFSKPPISGLQSSATRLFRARSGLFVYSRLFAFEGAYGIVDGEHDGYFVSNEYPMFVCNEDRLLPEFLVSYLLPASVWREIAEGSGGLGDRRQRVQPQHLLKHELLLPPLHWQQRIKSVRARLLDAASLQSETATQLNAMLPAILDRAFKGVL